MLVNRTNLSINGRGMANLGTRELRDTSLVLTLSCKDQPGITSSVTSLLYKNDFNILDSAQFGDSSTDRFFMRVHFVRNDLSSAETTSLRAQLEPLVSKFKMDYNLNATALKMRVMIMVSKIGHCLNDLLFRTSNGQLPIEIPCIVSNHSNFSSLAATYNIPFYNLPITPANKIEQEKRILELVRREHIDVIILARYMQIISPELCREMKGQIINIHHSFLPSFKGAKPYHQAYERGVKLIGATSHFVTSDLDEGPIIEQGIDRVDHSLTANDLVNVGSTVESAVLARAVKWVAERRVMMNGVKTVVL